VQPEALIVSVVVMPPPPVMVNDVVKGVPITACTTNVFGGDVAVTVILLVSTPDGVNEPK
jgi:hypothetical protein